MLTYTDVCNYTGMLALNMLSELKEIFNSVRLFQIRNYLTNAFNYIDWLSFLLQIGAWVAWYMYVNQTERFRIESRYLVLQDPKAKARFFTTSAEEEKKFLLLLTDLLEIGY